MVQGFSARRRTVDGRKEKEKRRQEKEGSCSKEGSICINFILSSLNKFKDKIIFIDFLKAFDLMF